MQSSENNNKESFSPAKEKIQDHTQAHEQKYSDFPGFSMCLNMLKWCLWREKIS